MQNYHDTYNLLPFEFSGSPVGTNPSFSTSNTGRSWIVAVLPYIEQKTLYDQVVFGAPVSNASNTKVLGTVIGTLLCPSDKYGNGIATTNDDGWGPCGISDYKASSGGNWGYGVVPVCVYADPFGRSAGNSDGINYGNGIICDNYKDNFPLNYTALRDISDGTSNTFAIGESVSSWTACVSWYSFDDTTANCGCPLNYPRTYAAGQSPPVDPSSPAMVALYQMNMGFHSLHPGGANFAMVDASVRSISQTIDMNIYRRLANFSDNQNIQVP